MEPQKGPLVEKPFIVTEYRRGWYWSEHCRCYHAAELPSKVRKAGLFGPKLISLIVYLKGRSHLSYKKFARLTSTELQFCWTHLIREVKFLAESRDKPVARYGNRLLKRIRKMFSTIHRRGELSDPTWKRQMQAHRDVILPYF